MATHFTDTAARVPSRRRSAAGLVLFGGLLGFAWAAGLRGFMTQITQDGSSVSWSARSATSCCPAW